MVKATVVTILGLVLTACSPAEVSREQSGLEVNTDVDEPCECDTDGQKPQQCILPTGGKCEVKGNTTCTLPYCEEDSCTTDYYTDDVVCGDSPGCAAKKKATTECLGRDDGGCRWKFVEASCGTCTNVGGKGGQDGYTLFNRCSDKPDCGGTCYLQYLSKYQNCAAVNDIPGTCEGQRTLLP
jgi:hypothetical protein